MECGGVLFCPINPSLGTSQMNPLEQLNRLTSRRARARQQAALELAGPVGLEALARVRPVEARLMEHALMTTRTWLHLAPEPIAGSRFAVERRANRLTVSIDDEPAFQLRFVPDRCAWLLLAKRGPGWWPAAFGDGGLSTQWKNLRRLWPGQPSGRK